MFPGAGLSQLIVVPTNLLTARILKDDIFVCVELSAQQLFRYCLYSNSNIQGICNQPPLYQNWFLMNYLTVLPLILMDVSVDYAVSRGHGCSLQHFLCLSLPRESLKQTKLIKVPSHSVRLSAAYPAGLTLASSFRPLHLNITLILQVHLQSGTLQLEEKGNTEVKWSFNAAQVSYLW